MFSPVTIWSPLDIHCGLLSVSPITTETRLTSSTLRKTGLRQKVKTTNHKKQRWSYTIFKMWNLTGGNVYSGAHFVLSPRIFHRNHYAASKRGTLFLLPGQICREEAHFCIAGLAGSRALFLWSRDHFHNHFSEVTNESAAVTQPLAYQSLLQQYRFTEAF